MNILILGGAGFLGNNLVRKCLEDKKNKVTVVDSLDKNFKSDINNLNEILHDIQFIKGDIRSKSLMEKVVKGQEVIFNCAAQTSHPLSLENPSLDIEINCIGTITILDAIRKYNPTAKVIYTSSSTVIGKAGEDTIDEKHNERPLDIYSANKGVAEKYHYIYHKVYGLKTLSLRFANLYGPYGKGYPEFGFINYFISRAYKNLEIPIYGLGNQRRNVMYVEDAYNLMYLAIKNEDIFNDTYFAVHKEHYTVIQIARMIISIFGKGKINKVQWPSVRKKIEIANMNINGAKLYFKLKWKPQYTLTEGLKRTKIILEQASI